MGYYVMTWGGGCYTAVAWYARRADAEAEVTRRMRNRTWRGMPPCIEPAN